MYYSFTGIQQMLTLLMEALRKLEVPQRSQEGGKVCKIHFRLTYLSHLNL